MAQTGLAPEKSRGTDGTGPRSQGIAPLGEVELVPSAGRGGWQCLSGLDPLLQQLPTLGCWGGWGGVARAFLVLSGDGTLMPRAPLAKASWHGRWLTRVGLEKQLLFWYKWGASALLKSRHPSFDSQAQPAQETTPYSNKARWGWVGQ